MLLISEQNDCLGTIDIDDVTLLTHTVRKIYLPEAIERGILSLCCK